MLHGLPPRHPGDRVACSYGIDYGIVAGMAAERKLTVHIPADLLEKAQRASGQGITETIRQGLRLLAAGETYRQLSKMRGKVKFSVDLTRLREDRR